MNRRFILFELNEVPIRVVEQYARQHEASAFEKILRHGRRWDTITPDQGHLSPWITWPTLHRGVSGAKHGVSALGQDVSDADRKYPPVWTMLASAGRSVGLFGSLHSYPVPKSLKEFAFYVPDTFAAGPEAHPSELSVFQSFNLHMVDRSGRNVSNELPMKEALGFLVSSLRGGLRPSTLAKIVRQLASERIWRHRSSRRRTIQSVLAFDLFRTQLRSTKPNAAFFFTNHVASAMHRYWPAAFREDYSVTKWSDAWVHRFSGELDYAMGEADQMLGELMEFADRNPDYLILVSGSMGQSAVDNPSRQVTTEVLIGDMEKFMHHLGVRGQWTRRRTMEPTYTLAFGDEADADLFESAMRQVKIAGQTVQCRRLDGHGVEFILGNSNVRDDEFIITIGNQTFAPDVLGVANVPIQDEVGAAAYHVPEGMFLAYDPRRSIPAGAAAERIQTTRIAPTLLVLQGLEPPAYMELPIEEFVPRVDFFEHELEPA